MASSRSGTTIDPDGSVQSGVLPWRSGTEGRLEILLITSTRRKRWIIPKGRPMIGLTLRESAMQEAFEEAGVRGTPEDEAIGSFITDKLQLNGDTKMLSVTVFPMEVVEELDSWPEQALRQRRWFRVEEAAKLAEPVSLRELITLFSAAKGGNV